MNEHRDRRCSASDVTDDRMPNAGHLALLVRWFVGRQPVSAHFQDIEKTMDERLFHRFDLTRIDTRQSDEISYSMRRKTIDSRFNERTTRFVPRT